MNQPKSKPSRRKQGSQVEPEPEPVVSQQRKNDLFGGGPDRKADLFAPAEDNIPGVRVPQRVVVKEAELSLKDERPVHGKEVTQERVDKISQTKIINEISEKLKENFNNQIMEIKQHMEEQQKNLIGELGNLKSEAKEAYNQKATAENELAQLKQELGSRKKVEEQYDRQLMRALEKNYDSKTRPDSKGRALMSRGKDNKELQNYEKLFFGNIESTAGGKQYPMKMYDKSGGTISGEGSLRAEGSLKAESKLINIGCVDPNKSLYMPNETGSKRSSQRSVDLPAMNVKKAVDTIDFLDQIAGGAKRNGGEKISAKPDNAYVLNSPKDAGSESSLVLDQRKLNKYLGTDNTIKSAKDSVATSAFNSMKLHEINKLNSQRLEDLSGLSPKKTEPSGGDELDKLDNLLLDIIKSEKDKKGDDSLRSSLGKKQIRQNPKLDAIHEADLEDSLKGSTKQVPRPIDNSIDLGNLQLPTLGSSPINI